MKVLQKKQATSLHSHPDKRFIMKCYRAYILDIKRKSGRKRGARALIHYCGLVQEYRACKEVVIEERRKNAETVQSKQELGDGSTEQVGSVKA